MPRNGGLGRWPVRRAVVRGPSMSPALGDGDVVVVVPTDRPRPGTLALVRWPSRPGQLSVKRITGRCGTGWWVVGDNPHGSTDSRELGPAEVLGSVRMRLWPLPRLLRRARRS